MIGLSLPVPLAAQVGQCGEVCPVFPHSARLPQQTQPILGLELRDPLPYGLVDDLVGRFAQALCHGFKNSLFPLRQMQPYYCHRASFSISYARL
jgi:hypothetical protein